VRQAYRILALLVAAEVVVQAMAIAYFVAGLSRWMATEGRVGDVHPSAMQSLDDAYGGPSGVLDKVILRSADKWLDAGVGLTIHRVAETAVAPTLTLLLLLVAFATKVRAAVIWAGVILLGVALQAWLGLVAPVPPSLTAVCQIAAFAVFATALYAMGRVAGPIRGRAAADLEESSRELGRSDHATSHSGHVLPSQSRRPGQDRTAQRVYRILAVLIAVGVVVQATALAYFVSGLNRYLTRGHAVVYQSMLYSATEWLDEGVGVPIHLATVFVVIPALAVLLVLVAFVTRVRGAVTWATIILVTTALQAWLDVVGAERPAGAAGYELVTFAVFTVALSAALWISRRLRAGIADPSKRLAPNLRGSIADGFGGDPDGRPQAARG
jgi:hypothetical protein